MIFDTLLMLYLLGIIGCALFVAEGQNIKMNARIIIGLLAWPICFLLAVFDGLKEWKKSR